MDRWSKTAGVGEWRLKHSLLWSHMSLLLATFSKPASQTVTASYESNLICSTWGPLCCFWRQLGNLPKNYFEKKKNNTNKTINGGSVTTAMQHRNREEKQIQEHCLAGRHHNQEQVWMIINRTAHILSLSLPRKLAFMKPPPSAH